MALSVETRVRVLRLLNVIATVLPDKAPKRVFGIDPVLIACLCKEAFCTRVVSSVEVRSDMERKWRGAKGEIGGVEGVE